MSCSPSPSAIDTTDCELDSLILAENTVVARDDRRIDANLDGFHWFARVEDATTVAATPQRGDHAKAVADSTVVAAGNVDEVAYPHTGELLVSVVPPY